MEKTPGTKSFPVVVEESRNTGSTLSWKPSLRGEVTEAVPGVEWDGVSYHWDTCGTRHTTVLRTV